MNWYKEYKIAGTVQSPPLLLKAIMQAIEEFNQTEDDIKRVEIPIDLTGWEYGGNELVDQYSKNMVADWEQNMLPLIRENPQVSEIILEGKTEKEYLDFIENTARALSLQLYKSPSDWVNERSPAAWNISLRFMAVLTTYYPGRLEEFIHHELVHWAQDLLSIAKNVDPSSAFGPPRRVKAPQFDIDPNTSQNSYDYINRDAEFQPLLITFFKELESKIETAKTYLQRNRKYEFSRGDVMDIFKRFIRDRLGPVLQPKREIFIKEIYKALEQNMSNYIAIQ